VPDLGQATHVDAEIYDPAFTPAIEEVRERLTAPALSLAVSVNGELIWAEARRDCTLLGAICLRKNNPS